MKNSLKPTKLALVRILQILEQYSDFDHPLKQQDIIDYLDKDYGIVIERKAVGRNLSLLKEAGYDIASDRRGSYLASRMFEDSELRILIDGVLASRHITAKHSKELIERLCSLSNRYFRSQKYLVGEFDKHFSTYDAKITRTKKIDFMLWKL